jgi:hypothetical protein
MPFSRHLSSSFRFRPEDHILLRLSTFLSPRFRVLGQFLWPAHLSADYSYNAVPLFGWQATNPDDVKALVALAVCLGAAVLTVLLAARWRSTGKPLFFFLVFFVVALSPVSNVIILIGAIPRPNRNPQSGDPSTPPRAVPRPSPPTSLSDFP